jgi:hypothetical protein
MVIGIIHETWLLILFNVSRMFVVGEKNYEDLYYCYVIMVYY